MNQNCRPFARWASRATLSLALTLASHALLAQQVVAVTQIVEHPALDAVRKGVKDGLEERGYVDGKNIRWQFQSAQGSPVIAAQIAQKFAGDEPAVIVAISTPSAQSVVAANKKIPVLFGAVTDALSTKLVSQLEHPGANVSGLLAFPPIAKQLEALAEIAPNAKRIGVIYNAGEANSVAIITALRALLQSKPYSLVETTITKSAEVGTAAESLVGKVDAILVAGDNTVTSALESVVRAAQPAKLPIVCGDPLSVPRGCTVGIGYNWYTSGRELAALVAQVLSGKAVGDIPVRSAEQIDLAVNVKAADAIGLKLPDAMIKRATTVIR
jgi:putative ABC transport system substrate-binding protein